MLYVTFGTVFGSSQALTLVLDAVRDPQVCLAMAADQFVNAEQLARRGAGIAIAQDDRDVESIRTAVEQVLNDDSSAARAAELQTEIDTMTPARDVLTYLEQRSARARTS